MTFLVGILILGIVVVAFKISTAIGNIPDYTFDRNESTDQPTSFWTNRDPGDEC